MHLLPRPGVKGQSLVTDIKHVRLIEHLHVNVLCLWKVSCKTWNLESWNLGILESWNLGILESYHIYVTAEYVIIEILLLYLCSILFCMR